MTGPVRIPPDPDAVPEELREREQWVAWRIETRDGEPTKLPVDADTGKLASTTNPETWGTFATAMGHYKAEGLAGVGFVFASDDPFTGVDLDDCRDPESKAIDGWARDVLRALDTYAEVSPSGTGVHAILRGEVPSGGHRSDVENGEIEVYDSGRYFTVTGQRLEIDL